MVVLVCGSRDFEDGHLIAYMLQGLHDEDEGLHIIHGDAKGADAWADIWGQTRHAYEDVKVTRYPADWDKHGKAAGVMRNQQMLDEVNPDLDLVIAFINKDLAESKGTADMVVRARKAGVKTIIVQVMS